LRTTGSVHEQEIIGGALVSKVQAGGGVAVPARREPGCTELKARPDGGGTVPVVA